MGAFGGPDIITDGLVLALDAGSERSYPGTGTSWYDLSGNNFDFTIDVALNVGVLMRGADEKTVTKINNILTKLLNNNTIQDIYAAYGIEYVAPK